LECAERPLTPEHRIAKAQILSTKNSNLFVVLGADRSFYETLNINAQYLYRHTFDYFQGTIR
jgi:hypothetical protein